MSERSDKFLAAKIHNEKQKLAANFFNGCAVVCIGVGGLRQVLLPEPVTNVKLVTMFAMLVLAFLLHQLARRYLSQLREED